MPCLRSTLGLFHFLLFSTVVNLSIRAQTNGQAGSSTDETWSAACSAKIERPLYPVAAVSSRLTGTASASFAVDRAGRAAALELGGPDVLAEAARTAIDATVFPVACTGRRLKVTFSFKTEPDLPAQYLVSSCFFHPPNTFWVVANAIKLVCAHSSYDGALVAPGGLTPITVCELLANPAAYNGKDVALLGRSDPSVGDNARLSEDDCGSLLNTQGRIWPNSVFTGGGSSGPNPPLGVLVLDPDGLARKLELVRQTTSLKMQETRVFREGKAETRSIKQHWAVIFGRIETREQLRPPSGVFPNHDFGNGFGSGGVFPAQITYAADNEFYIRDTASDR